MARKIRLCLVGCGYMARENHAPAHRLLSERGQVDLTACCDLDPERARSVQQIAGYSKVYADLRVMLHEQRPDALCVAVPDTVMAATVSEALQRGIPVLLEKPPARTLRELDGMIELAAQKRVITQVAFNRRFMPTTAEFTRRLQSIGRPRELLGIMTRVRRLDPDFTTTAIHLVDAVRHILGEDYARLQFRYEQGGTANEPVTNYLVKGASVSGVEVHLAICPSAGRSMEQLTAVWGAGQPVRVTELHMPVPGGEREEPGFVRELASLRFDQVYGQDLAGSREPFVASGVFAENAAFIEAVQHGRPCRSDLQASRQSMQIMLAMRHRENHWQA